MTELTLHRGLALLAAIGLLLGGGHLTGVPPEVLLFPTPFAAAWLVALVAVMSMGPRLPAALSPLGGTRVATAGETDAGIELGRRLTLAPGVAALAGSAALALSISPEQSPHTLAAQVGAGLVLPFWGVVWLLVGRSVQDAALRPNPDPADAAPAFALVPILAAAAAAVAVFGFTPGAAAILCFFGAAFLAGEAVDPRRPSRVQIAWRLEAGTLPLFVGAALAALASLMTVLDDVTAPLAPRVWAVAAPLAAAALLSPTLPVLARLVAGRPSATWAPVAVRSTTLLILAFGVARQVPPLS